MEQRGERRFDRRNAGRSRQVTAPIYTFDRDKAGLPTGLKNGGVTRMPAGHAFSNNEIRHMRFIRHQRKHGRS